MQQQDKKFLAVQLEIEGLDELNSLAEQLQKHIHAVQDTLHQMSRVRCDMEARLNAHPLAENLAKDPLGSE